MIDVQGLYPVKKSDFARAQKSLTRAFIEYPLYRCLISDPQKRWNFIYHMMAFILSYGLKYGMVYAPDKQCEGVAAWLPSQAVNVPLFSFLRHRGLGLILKSSLKRVLRFQKVTDAMEHAHHQLIQVPHWYLFTIGVAPEKQGQGLGKRLMLPVLQWLEKEGCPCFLETLLPVNEEIYGSLGFVTRQKTILPVINQTAWFMIKE